jgi:hypothetical protein
LGDRAGALKQADALIVVPVRRADTLCVVGAFADAGRNRRRRIDEPGPFEGRTIGIDRVVDTTRLAARIGLIRLAILVAESAKAVPEFMSDRIPGDAERQDREPAAAATAEAGIVK